MAINGKEVLIYVYDKDYTGSTYADKYIPLAEQTSLSDETNMNLIEAGHKGANHQKYIYGKEEGSFSVEALYVKNPSADEKGLLVLKNCRKNRKVAYVKITDGTNTEYAEVLVESIGKEFPDDDVSTVSVDLKRNAEVSSSDIKVDANTSGSTTA